MSLSETRRVLKLRGKGIFMEPLANSKLLYNFRQLVPVAVNESPGGGGLNKKEFLDLLGRMNLSHSFREFELLTRLERLPGLNRYQAVLRKLDHKICTSFPPLRHFARTAVIEIARA
jgi:hypothetical protein